MDQGHLPDAVTQPDGRTEPFEPERITRTLFAASERIGRPDAFLARELTDGVLHFLSNETFASSTTADDIERVVIKVVRELGHPDLATAYERRQDSVRRELGPMALAMARNPYPNSQVRWSLEYLFPRELVAAHHEGLIQLGGLGNTVAHGGCYRRFDSGDDARDATLR